MNFRAEKSLTLMVTSSFFMQNGRIMLSHPILVSWLNLTGSSFFKITFTSTFLGSDPGFLRPENILDLSCDRSRFAFCDQLQHIVNSHVDDDAQLSGVAPVSHQAGGKGDDVTKCYEDGIFGVLNDVSWSLMGWYGLVLLDFMELNGKFHGY